jgi:methyl-accepting chemotaxis protein
MTLLFLAMLVVIAVILTVVYLFISGLLKPLHKIIKTLDLISTDWDMTRRLDIRSNDEIGNLGAFFNLTFGRIMEVFKQIKGKTLNLSTTGDELSVKMTSTTAVIKTITNDIDTMMEKVMTQADHVNTSVGTMEGIIDQLGKLNNSISTQSECVAQSSASIEQMLANIHSVTETLVKNTANINLLAESSDAGRGDLQKVSDDIQEIAKESEGLLEINAVMENIASQTNLLSMNAAIEAAHAGETGKGFAVVAGEIRKLAENSSQQSKTISTVQKKIKASIDTITKSTGVVMERFGTIEQEVTTVSNQEAQIRNAMQEQETGSRSILESISRLNSVTDLVKNTSHDMTAKSKEVLQQSSQLKTLTIDVSGSMDEMSGSANEISSAVTRVNEISRENKENITSLSGDIARFKVE